MTHIRTQIRNALAALFAGDVVAGTFKSVETDRAHAMDEDKLPALRIYCAGEDVTGRANDSVIRQDQWKLDCHARGAPLQDQLDALALVAEQRVAANPTLGGLVMHTVYSGAAFETSGDGAKRTGLVSLTFTTLTATVPGNPQIRN